MNRKSNKQYNRKKVFCSSLVILSVICVIVAVIRYKDSEGKETETNNMQIAIEKTEEYYLADGLVVQEPASYAGVYMEDGSNDIVENVMMIILTNTNEKDLQLARIYITYQDWTAEFECTNLPSGEAVVLLEKNRQRMSDETQVKIETENVLFFEKVMNLHQETFEVTEHEKMLEIKNITEKDIGGDIYIYYKNSAADLLYGGITYRTKVSGGLKAGAAAQLAAAHFSQGNTRILNIDIVEPSGE